MEIVISNGKPRRNRVHGGTASAEFREIAPELRARIFAKTGTAILHKTEKLYTGWLVGSLNPRPGQKGGRRIAFGCEAANVTVYGAEACGPVVAKFLEEWDRR